MTWPIFHNRSAPSDWKKSIPAYRRFIIPPIQTSSLRPMPRIDSWHWNSTAISTNRIAAERLIATLYGSMVRRSQSVKKTLLYLQWNRRLYYERPLSRSLNPRGEIGSTLFDFIEKNLCYEEPGKSVLCNSIWSRGESWDWSGTGEFHWNSGLRLLLPENGCFWDFAIIPLNKETRDTDGKAGRRTHVWKDASRGSVYDRALASNEPLGIQVVSLQMYS